MMKRFMTLLISGVAFFVPLLSRAMSFEQGDTNKVGSQSNQQEAEEVLFLKLKERMDPRGFDEGRNYFGMRTKG